MCEGQALRNAPKPDICNRRALADLSLRHRRRRRTTGCLMARDCRSEHGSFRCRNVLQKLAAPLTPLVWRDGANSLRRVLSRSGLGNRNAADPQRKFQLGTSQRQ